jgi:beta-lactamase regulating signal transducer with metallopeptidase domain
MRYQQLMLLSALATFALTSTIVGACVALTWRRVASTSGTSRARARMLFALRVAPAALGALLSALTVLAFSRYEPRSTSEVPGWILIVGAAAGAGLVIAGIWRGITRCWKTHQFLTMTERTAARVNVPDVELPTWQVDTRFPLVAVAGLGRSRLLVARRVLTEMPRDELELVLRHELAHAQHHDNIARLLLTAAPDLFSVGRWRLPMERSWREAAEDAADDFAAGGDGRARACLASALIRVARMAQARATSAVPVPAFHEGESIDRRIRRLVTASELPPDDGVRQSRRRVLVAAVVVGVGVVVSSQRVLMVMHALVEWLVHVRP